MPRVWEKGASGDFDRVAGTGRVSVSLSSGPGPRDASPKRKGTAPGWGDKLDAALRSAWPGGVISPSQPQSYSPAVNEMSRRPARKSQAVSP